jgi:hypothetical protein
MNEFDRIILQICVLWFILYIYVVICFSYLNRKIDKILKKLGIDKEGK